MTPAPKESSVKGKLDLLIVLKLGTNVLQNDTKSLDKRHIQEISMIVRRYAGKILIVSSGAVALGKELKSGKYDSESNETLQKRKYAGVGQPELVRIWGQYLNPNDPHQPQVLVDYEKSLEETKGVIHSYLADGEVPILNWNDVTSSLELKGGRAFDDNDRLARLVATECCGIANKVSLVICSTPPEGSKEKLIRVYNLKNLESFKSAEKTVSGTGDGNSKIGYMQEAFLAGVDPVVLADGRDVENLGEILSIIDAGSEPGEHANGIWLALQENQ